MSSTSSRIASLTLLATWLSGAAADEPSPEPPPQRITAAKLARLRELPTLEREAWKIVARPDGKQIAFVRWEKPVEILEPQRLRTVSTFGKGKLIAFAFSKDPDVVAYSLNGGGAFIRNLKTKKEFELDVGRAATRRRWRSAPTASSWSPALTTAGRRPGTRRRANSSAPSTPARPRAA